MRMFNRTRQLQVLEGEAALDALDADFEWYMKRQEIAIVWGLRLQGFLAGGVVASAVWLVVMLTRH